MMSLGMFAVLFNRFYDDIYKRDIALYGLDKEAQMNLFLVISSCLALINFFFFLMGVYMFCKRKGLKSLADILAR